MTSSNLAQLPIALLIALSSTGIASAQEPEQPEAPAQLQSITVVAPRITYHTERQRDSAKRVRVDVAKQSAMVEYGDLDLSRTAGLYALEDRVHQAAEQVCSELADLYPEGEPSTPVCVRRATDDAMAQVRSRARQATN
jgi:UrcA family protein